MTRFDPEDIDALAKVAHNAYELAARVNGWETNEETRVPWEAVPEANRACTRASVEAVMEYADLWVPSGATFRITFFSDGHLEVQGDPDKSSPTELPAILRMIADSIDAGEMENSIEHTESP